MPANRKPARLERAGALTPRDRMWAAMRALATARDPDTEAWFSPVEVQHLANVSVPAENQAHIDSVLTYLKGLSKAEPPYVSVADGDRPAGRKRAELSLYRLLRDVGVDAPRVTDEGKPHNDGAGVEQMWAAMRVLREFDREELVAAASTPERAISPDTARRYLYHLEQAGYLTVAKECIRGKGGVRAKRRFRFNRSMNTGPRPPLVCKDKSVMDGNNGNVVYTPTKGEKGCQAKT